MALETNQRPNRRATHHARARRVHEQVVSGALAALRAPYVNLFSRERTGKADFEVTWEDGPDGLLWRAAAGQMVSGYDTGRICFPASANPYVRALFVDGQ